MKKINHDLKKNKNWNYEIYAKLLNMWLSILFNQQKKIFYYFLQMSEFIFKSFTNKMIFNKILIKMNENG